MKRMKRLFALALCLITLLTSLSLPTWALSKPAGSAEGSNVPELKTSTTPINMDNLLTLGLTSSPNCSIKTILDTHWTTSANITEEAQADIANHLKYGFSVAGVSRLQRAVWGAVDFVWATGNKGAANSAGASSYGAFSYALNEYLYNYKGEKVLNPEDGRELAEGESYGEAPEGFDYQMLMTFNFGEIANIESFGFTCDKTQLRALPQAADIYVSNNGTDWTLIGYYDRIQKRLDGEDYTTIYTQAMLGADSTEVVVEDANAAVLLFDLPEGTKGQFLRIAYTANFGKLNDIEEYGEGQRVWYEPVTSYFTFREMFVFGTKTGEVGYEYVPEETTVDENQTTDGGDETINVVVKPKDETTVKDETTENPSNNETETSEKDEDDKKGGCGSTAGIGIAVIASVSAAGVMMTKRRRKA